MTKIDLSHQGFELTDDIKAYVHAKIGKLDKFVNRLKRRSVWAEVRLIEEKGHKKDRFTAEVVLHMPLHSLTAKESNNQIFATIDLVEAKLTSQLRKVKGKTTDRRVNSNKFLRKVTGLAKRR